MTRRMMDNLITALVVGVLLVLILVATSGCTIYRLKVPQDDGTVVSAFVMYPPGKKVNLSNLEIGEFKLGSAKGEQPGPGEYTKAMMQILQLMTIQQTMQLAAPLRPPEGEDE